MKRKKLTEFANFLANMRHNFDMDQACDCVAGHAERFLQPKGPRHAVDGNSNTMARAFGLTDRQSSDIYRGPSWLNGKHGQKVAVAMLRWLVKHGSVDWNRAQRAVGD